MTNFKAESSIGSSHYRKTLMIIGLGDLGSKILQILGTGDDFLTLIVCSRSKRYGESFCNMIRSSAISLGKSPPDIIFSPLDVMDHESTKKIIGKFNPDMILFTASMYPWWVTQVFRENNLKKWDDIPFGGLLPIHLALIFNFMQVLRKAGYRGLVLNAAYPDVINCTLGKLDLAPTSGIGNLDGIIPKIILSASEKMRVPPESISVYLVAHHSLDRFLNNMTTKDRPPFYLQILHENNIVTESANGEQLLFSSFPLPCGLAYNFLTACSAVSLIRAVLSGARKLLHSPGPLGLPGGYPIEIYDGKISLANLKEIGLDEEIAINMKSQVYDGIQDIADDGKIIFCETLEKKMFGLLGYKCQGLTPQNSYERSLILIEKLNTYSKNHDFALKFLYDALKL